ncbi:WD40 repeat domain-containing protein [Bradyrhizobium sp. CCGB01]|uniref:WD40 repeat domain-containing protein n=1 Tax=Bradyrhizobium sp. CCGB01 TaxID=2949634 RepID=UPI0020B35D17|nr:hypothetical protein [Bradyrhizobium sp. CCGB01]MCP3404468.1 hypothetical protein [Bradyrhizobium sp. CCGB01]
MRTSINSFASSAWLWLVGIFRMALWNPRGMLGVGFLAFLLAISSEDWITKVSPYWEGEPVTHAASLLSLDWFGENQIEFLEQSQRAAYFSAGGTMQREQPIFPSEKQPYDASIKQVGPETFSTFRDRRIEAVVPGGLIINHPNGSLYLTGAARLRDTSGNYRAISANAPDPRSIWKVPQDRESTPFVETKQAQQFFPIFSWNANITAMLALPSPRQLAVGGADGHVAVIYEERTGAESRDAHRAPVLALATSRAWKDQARGPRVVSAASDGSIKLWFENSDNFLESKNISFPEDALPILGPDSLEMSRDGTLLLVRTVSGYFYASDVSKLDNEKMELVRLDLDFVATASVMGSGKTLYAAAAQDCSIRELRLMSSDETGDGGITPARLSFRPSTTTILRGHGRVIGRLVVSEDGRYLAAADLNRRVRIYDLPAYRRLAALPFAALPTGPECENTTVTQIPEEEPLAGTAVNKRSFYYGELDRYPEFGPRISCEEASTRGGVEAFAKQLCGGVQEVTLTVANSIAGNKCGYTRFEVVCTGSKK